MNYHPKIEAVGATVATVGNLTVGEANEWLHLGVGALTLLWWLRLWIKKPQTPPPGIDSTGRRIPVFFVPLLLGVFLSGALIVSGCAYNRPSLTVTEAGTNGVTLTRTLTIPTFAIWPATTELARQKASVGKTLSVGTDGLEQQAGSSTNDVQILHAILRLLNR